MDKRNLRAVQAGYDKIAADYAQGSFQRGETAEQPVDQKVLDLLVARVEGVVCDLGCGPGHHARYLRDQGVQVVGVDLSPGMLAQARLRNPDIEFLQASMYRLPVANESWGAIAAMYSIIHIPRGETVRVLREIRRTLCSGGLLLLAFYVGQATIRSWRWKNIPVSMTYTHFRSGEMDRYLTKAGFALEGDLEIQGDPGSAMTRYVFARKP